MNNWTPRRFKPTHLRVVLLYWSGTDNQTGPAPTFSEIAAKCGYSAEHVRRILESDEAKDILADLAARTLDTVSDIEIAAQAIAPAIFDEKCRLALQSNDERVRNSACSDILAIAGHQPVKRISIERPDPIVEKYKDLTDDQIREQVVSFDDKKDQTVH